MKRIIIIIMIIVISLTIVIMPIRNPFGWDNRYIPLTDVSAAEMGIYGYAPAFIAWLIAMLASMGLNISSLSEFEELLQQVEFKAIVEAQKYDWENMTMMEKAGIVPAQTWKDVREIWQGWTVSDEAVNLKTDTIYEYLQNLSQNGYYSKTVDGFKYIYTGSNTVNDVVGYSTMTAGDLIDFIEYYGYRNDNEYYTSETSEKYEFRFNTIKPDGSTWSCSIYRDGNKKYDTIWSNAYYIPVQRGWIYSVKTATNYNPDVNDNIGSIIAMPYMVYCDPSGTNYYKYSGSSEIVIDNTTAEGLTKPQVITKPKFSIPIDDTYIGENDIVSFEWDAQVEQDIALALAGTIPMDLDLPQDVAVTTTNPVITNVIYNTVTIPVEDIDFPDIDNFKIPTGITTKFPFSIPFDVYRAFQMLEATPEIPHWEIPIRVENIVDETIVIDLEDYQGLINIVRWFLLAIFILGLILATRGLIKG